MTSKPRFWKFISHGGDARTYYALCKVTEKSLRPFRFVLTLFSGGSVWKGEIPNEKLIDLSEKAELTIQEFCFVTRRALTGESPEETNESFVFVVEKSSFSWKKKLADGILYHLGSTKLTKLENDDEISSSFNSLFQFCFEQIDELTNKNELLEQDTFSSNQDRLGALERLNEAIKAKEECETVMYSKFVDVLNSKKRKIVQLEMGNDNNFDSPTLLKTDDGGGGKNRKKIDTKEKPSKNNDDEETMDTDDERDVIEKKRIHSDVDRQPFLEDKDLILHTKKSKPSTDDEKTQVQQEDNDADRLFVPKRESRPSRRQTKKSEKLTVEQSSSTSSKVPDVDERRRSTRQSSQKSLSSSSLLDKLS